MHISNPVSSQKIGYAILKLLIHAKVLWTYSGPIDLNLNIKPEKFMGECQRLTNRKNGLKEPTGPLGQLNRCEAKVHIYCIITAVYRSFKYPGVCVTKVHGSLATNALSVTTTINNVSQLIQSVTAKDT